MTEREKKDKKGRYIEKTAGVLDKAIIFDSGPLINFSMNGLLPLLVKLKKEFKGDFLITKEVKEEIIDRPIGIKRFELGALRLKKLLDEDIIKLANITSEQVNQLRKKRDEFMNVANSTFNVKNKNLHLIDKGECAALALSAILKQPNALAIDERTTRILCENPENLQKLLQKKLKAKIKVKKENFDLFRGFKIIRSTELIYMAKKRNLIELKDPKAYGAMLYAVKFNGTSISENEIKEMIKK